MGALDPKRFFRIPPIVLASRPEIRARRKGSLAKRAQELGDSASNAAEHDAATCWSAAKVGKATAIAGQNPWPPA